MSAVKVLSGSLAQAQARTSSVTSANNLADTRPSPFLTSSYSYKEILSRPIIALPDRRNVCRVSVEKIADINPSIITELYLLKLTDRMLAHWNVCQRSAKYLGRLSTIERWPSSILAARAYEHGCPCPRACLSTCTTLAACPLHESRLSAPHPTMP